MKSFSEWKNEQLRKRLAEDLATATPVPSVPMTVNGDPNNAIPQNGNPMMPAQQPMQSGMRPKPQPNPAVANQPKPGMPQPRPGMANAQVAPGTDATMQQSQPDPKQFFGNTRFAPHIRQKLVNRQNAQGEPL